MVAPVEAGDSRSGLTSEEYAGGGVPGFVGQHYRGVEVAGRVPGEVDGGAAKHAYALSARREDGGDAQASICTEPESRTEPCVTPPVAESGYLK